MRSNAGLSGSGIFWSVLRCVGECDFCVYIEFSAATRTSEDSLFCGCLYDQPASGALHLKQFSVEPIEELFKLSYKIVNRTIEVKTIVSTPFEKKIELFTEFDFLLKCPCFLPIRANSHVFNDGIK